MRFDILGRVVNARVTSIRDVDFKDARAGGFMFVFRPGTLEQAPQTYIAPVKGPSAGPAARAKFQHDLVSRFPNVSVIDFHEILETMRDVMSKVTLAITVVGVPRAVQRRPDSRRRGRDDEVSARVRGGRLQDARGEHPHDRDDAAASSTACWARWRAWWDRPAPSR